MQVLHGMHTDDPSYILRIDKKTGKTVWRIERPTNAERESPDSYTTPTLIRNGKMLELIVSGGDYVTGHDLATGKELWRGGGFNPGQEPVQSGDRFADGLRRRRLRPDSGTSAASVPLRRPSRFPVSERPGCSDAGDGRQVFLFDQRPGNRDIAWTPKREPRSTADKG